MSAFLSLPAFASPYPVTDQAVAAVAAAVDATPNGSHHGFGDTTFEGDHCWIQIRTMADSPAVTFEVGLPQTLNPDGSVNPSRSAYSLFSENQLRIFLNNDREVRLSDCGEDNFLGCRTVSIKKTQMGGIANLTIAIIHPGWDNEHSESTSCHPL